jgi:hypothetical protein
MTREQVNHRNSEDLSSVFDRASFFRLASLFFLMLIYPLLAMLWYHSYPVFSAEVGILLSAAMVFAAWLDNFVNPSTRLHELAPAEN